MKNEEIVRALRCVSTAGGENACEHCPYWMEESVPAEMRDMVGADVFHSCDIDRVGLDGADLIEKLTDRCARYAEEIAVAQERTRWIPVTERLPETDAPVLCWYEYFRYGNYNRMYQAYGIGYCTNGMWGGKVSNGRSCKVLAWMPLPEPPEEAEKALEAMKDD